MSCRFRKQSVTATSSCEAEYVASCTAAKEAVWLARLVADILTTTKALPITIAADNQGAIELTKIPAINQQNKHIAIQYHYVRDLVRTGTVVQKYCPTENMVADTLTKPLDRVRFNYHKTSMSVGPKYVFSQ